MRKYRGLTDTKQWVEGWYCQVGDRHCIISDDAQLMPTGIEVKYRSIDGFVEVDPETVGQETGIKDKNGKEEVYVGDDIYFSMSQTQHYKGYVKWSEKGLCYVVECYWQKQDEILHLCDGFEMKYKYKNSCVRRLDSECFDIEIIGTMAEDSHLLEGK